MEYLPLSALLKRWRQSARRSSATRGFTLVEMLVVIFIITILLSVILVGESSFNNTLFLSNTAYTVATSIRSTESLGISSTAYSTSYANPGYGTHFDTSSLTSYIEYADIISTQTLQTSGWCPVDTSPSAEARDCVYNGSGEKVVQYTLNQGMKIADFCAYNGATLVGCATSNGDHISTLDIEFVRPSLDAVITVSNGLSVYQQANLACVKLSAPGNTAFRYIEVNQLGEIAVTSSCP